VTPQRGGGGGKSGEYRWRREGSIDLDHLQPMSILMEGPLHKKIHFLRLSGRGGDPAVVTQLERQSR